ncbi:MAG: hypothetical protein AAF959_08260 [Cyanobacteria bacterium P01_D01_bin.56]
MNEEQMRALLAEYTEPLIEQIKGQSAEIQQLKEQLLLQSKDVLDGVWVEPDLAAASLGLSSGRALHQWRTTGKLRAKTHFRNVATPGAKVPCWQYHVPNCQKLLERQI